VGNTRLAAGAVLAALLMGASACSNNGQAVTNGKGAPTASPQATVRITPVNGTAGARPDRGVTVTALDGKLAQVSVVQNGRPVIGSFTADHTKWTTKWTLRPGASYSVAATAQNTDGKMSKATSAFRTARATQTFGVLDITPMPGETVGVGMPIIVTFDRAIANRAFVEKALEVRSDHKDLGAWSWISDQQVVFRTKKYWHSHQRISLTAHLAGVRGLRGVYGTADVSRSFEIGASNIAVANGRTHRMKVTHDGVVKRFPISMGRASTKEYTTTSGIHLTQEKRPTVTMVSPHRKKGDPGYYKEKVHLAVRITARGEYVHQSVGEYYFLGKQNASHGCVRTSPTGARYFYEIAQRGDVVNVTGTDRDLGDEPGNGWTFWTTSWSDWLDGSALKH
jgi:lipoprotein-anchoring transpeptidase ErfK/SrfK